MAVIPLLAMVRKDLQLFFSDRRSVIVSFVVPIAIASFFGSVFSGAGQQQRAGAHRHRDRRPGRQRDLEGDRRRRRDRQEPEDRDARPRTRPASLVKNGKTRRRRRSFPRASAMRPARAFFGGGDKPALGCCYDPSRSMELAMVRGVLTAARDGGGEPGDVRRRSGPPADRAGAAADQASPNDAVRAAQAARCDMLSSVQTLLPRISRLPSARGAARAVITMPYTVQRGGDDRRRRTSPTTATRIRSPAWGSSSCCSRWPTSASRCCSSGSAGCGTGCAARRSRRRRCSPARRSAARSISLMILLVSFAFAMIVFKVRIQGSVARLPRASRSPAR